MQVKKIELPLPLPQIKNTFKIPILKAKIMESHPSYNQVITSYGTMCLVIEYYIKANGRDNSKWLTQRNKIMGQNKKCFPLIFQQHIVQNKDGLFCLTLMETCVSLTLAIKQGLEPKLLNYHKLVFGLRLIEGLDLRLQKPIQINQLKFLNNSQQICFDFTQLQPIQQNEGINGTTHLKNVLQLMRKMLVPRYDSAEGIHEIIFIQGKIYAFQPQKLPTASDYFELLVFMNTCLDMQVSLIARTTKIEDSSPAKIKKVKLKNLQGNPIIEYNTQRYSSLHFDDGKCINCLRQVFYQQLSTKFIHQNSLYKLQQFEHLVVHIFKNHGGSLKEEIITVYPPVNKVGLISFLIAYLKCIEPVMKSIQYFPLENTLRLVFQNRKKQQKVLTMVFYEDYIVKDEQISMILQKSNLNKCKLNLKEMKISDSFLVFLSHIEKAKQISQLHLTDSHGLSDIGLSTFLRCPYSQNLETLSLSAVSSQNSLLEQSLQVISSKMSLKKLYLKKYSLESSIFSDEIDVSKLQLVQLVSMGLKITLSSVMKGTLKILKIDQQVNVDQLKNIKHLQLIQLRVRLIQNTKKSLMDSFSSLSSLSNSFTGNKNQSARIFAEGQSRSTLKKLDLSLSNCKFKTIRPLLLMKQLEQIILDGCINFGTEFEPISPKILSVSLENVDLVLENIQIILRDTKQLLELNLINTKVQKYQIIKLVTHTKMHIQNLMISQLQYVNKLLETSGGYQLIQCIQLYIDKLLEPEQEYSLNTLFSKAAVSQKIIRFILTLEAHPNRKELQQKKQILISRINKFIIMNNTPLESLSNLYFNKIKITELLQIQQNFQVEDSCESTIASSIAISAERCRIVSSPKILIRKNSQIPIMFRVLERETIDKFTHRFVKFMQDNNQPISIDMSQNKLIGREVVNVLLQYGGNLVREIDMRGCMFAMNDVIDGLFELGCLESVNGGECGVWLGKEKFGELAQKHLKFFMRIAGVTALRIQCQQVQDLQILYSVLSHIIDHCSPTLQQIDLVFRQIIFNKQSHQFLKTLFNVPHIKTFSMVLQDCCIADNSCSEYWHTGLSQLRGLEKLSLSLPSLNFPLINLSHLVEANLQFADGFAQEAMVNKCLRTLQNSRNLKDLRISVANSPNIANLNRIFGLIPVGTIFDRLPNLQHLCLNFEYCPLKQITLHQLLSVLIKCESLSFFELNVSFAVKHFGEFVNVVETLVDQIIRPVSIKIICVTENSNTYLLKTESLAQKGVAFII